MHLPIWLPPLILGILLVFGVASLFVRPKMRDRRLDRTWAGRPGKYDSPARPPRR